jgi:hypothetical protein
VIAYFLVIAVASIVITYVIMKIFTSESMEKPKQWFLFKLNGFMAAREKMRNVRPEEKPYKPPKPKKVRREIEVNVLGFLPLVWNFLVAIKKGICPMVEFIEEKSESGE